MRVKEMFLKKVFDKKFIIILSIFVFLTLSTKSNEHNSLENALIYFKTLDEFSSSFLQIQNNNISEGLIFIKGDRLRIEYTSPSNLIFVLKKNKGMYFNKELEEVEYFNPQNTIGQFLIDLFHNDKFLSESHTAKGEGYFYINKKIQLDSIDYLIKIYFEERPFQLRKLEIINDVDFITFTIINPNHNPSLNDKIFSLANPLLS